MLAATTSIHPPRGGGVPTPAPPTWPRASWGVSIRLAPARSDNSPGGDPAAQRGLPREGSPLIPGLTRAEDEQLQIAPSPFTAGAAAVRPSSRLRCSPVRLDKRARAPGALRLRPVRAGERRPRDPSCSPCRRSPL